MDGPFDWLSAELSRVQSAGLLRSRRCVRPLEGGWCEVDGRRARNFAANDYLDLARDPRVIAAAIEATSQAGAGSSASALVTGRTPWHAALEQQLAEFEQQPAAVLFPSGYAANLGTLGALLGEADVVFCDRFNHSSLVEGCRLTGAKLRIYRHDDLAGLTHALEKATGYRRRAIVTDSVFSMDGDLAPLPELCDLAERHQAMLIVDEAHGTGVLGEHGRGVAELQGIEQRPLVRIGTLSKALGSLGGFVTGSKELCSWLWTTARSQIYSTALPASACAAASMALSLAIAEPWRRQNVQKNARSLTHRLREAGLNVPESVASPIIPVILGEPRSAVDAGRELLDRGFLVASIRPPTVPQGASRLRITVTAVHSTSDVDDLATAVIASCSHFQRQ